MSMQHERLTSPINDQCSHDIETSKLICNANQLTGLYVVGNIGRQWVEFCSHLAKDFQGVFRNLSNI